ncbi:13788_t:CDS:10 [Entrophospora sp. SA101]|nr:2814_t:CDS:10 [Entrophospora sp. SA101]CAJ0637322.1 13788_t:CDS:10 [Entrophospora sp. SA101]
MPKLINKINYYEKDTPDKRLTKLLIILGDKMSPQEIHSNIGIVSNLIQTEYAKYEINILKAIKNCFMELPTKTFVYGTLIGLLNVARSDIGAAIVKMTSQSLQQCLNEGNWRGAKLSLKFFAELTNSNVILPRTMLDIYDDLLTTLDEPNVKMVATRLHDRSPDILEGILSKIERYFYARDRAIKEIDGLLVLNSVRPYVGSNIPYEQVDVIVPLFRIFDELDDETKNEHLEITDISYFLICDLIGDIIDIFEINRKECTKYLKDIAYSFAPGTFINKDTTHTKNSEDSTEIKIGTEDTAQKILENDTTANVSNLNKNIKCFQLEQMIVENIFSEIFRLPQPKRLDIMDVECCYRFWNWFAHHLSNFGFLWNWKDWENNLMLDPLHPKVCFMRETLEKTIRYSYYERISSTIPEELMVIFPKSEPSTNFRYENPEDPLHTAATNLISKLRTKSSNSEVLNFLEELHKDFPSLELDQDTKIRDLFIQCVLMLGSKSFSHVLNVIERYLTILQSLNETFEAKLHTVKIVADFWANNTQFLGILLDKLLNYRVIDAISIISWLFADEMEKDIARQVTAKLEILQNPHADDSKIQGIDITSEVIGENSDEKHNLENTLNVVKKEQKEVLIKMVQMFASLLEKKLNFYKQQGIQNPLSQLWFWWAFGLFKEIGRLYEPQLSTFMVTLENIVITPNTDPNILSVFEIVKAIGHMRNLVVSEDIS